MLQTNKKGFTIIEVLIVLAIAAVILLIVFLAVPELQRNYRNNAYKNEAARVLAATIEFTNNNGGNLPVCPGNTYPCNNTFPSSSDDPGKIFALANTKYITDVNEYNAPGVIFGLLPQVTIAYIETGVTCGTVVGGTVDLMASGPAKSIIVIFATESAGGGTHAQCLQG